MGLHRFELEGGRVLAYEDVGDPRGRPVVYLHGTPDCRLARHPDDSVAASCGVRLLAIDRPGYGGTTPTPRRAGVADDVARLLDHLRIPSAALLGWSSGGLAALSARSHLGERCSSATLVGTLPPVEAYGDADLVAALGPSRRSFVELAIDGPAEEIAAEVAPYLVPDPLDLELARAHVLEGAGDLGAAELASVPGALDQMARALVEAVRQGTAGIEADLVHQLQPGLELHGFGLPLHLVHGELDPVSPPVVGRWIAARVPGATVEVVPEAAHHVLFPHWERILRELVIRDPEG